jgi:hypothetical protein
MASFLPLALELLPQATNESAIKFSATKPKQDRVMSCLHQPSHGQWPEGHLLVWLKMGEKA